MAKECWIRNMDLKEDWIADHSLSHCPSKIVLLLNDHILLTIIVQTNVFSCRLCLVVDHLFISVKELKRSCCHLVQWCQNPRWRPMRHDGYHGLEHDLIACPSEWLTIQIILLQTCNTYTVHIFYFAEHTTYLSVLIVSVV